MGEFRFWGALTLSAFCSWSVAAAPIKIVKDIPYGSDSAQRLDLCLPEGTVGPVAVVALHGGGLMIGDKGYLTARVCSWFAPLGVAVVSVNYRLADGTPHGAWPAPIADAQLAVRWFRSHAEEYGVKFTRLCAVGASAGGYLAALLDVLHTPVPSDVSNILPDVPSGVDCAVNMWGPTDFTSPSPLMRKELALLFPGASLADSANNARLVSPVAYAGKDMGPMLIVQGDADPATPPNQATAFAALLKTYGVRADLVTFAGKHGMPSADWNALGRDRVAPFVMTKSEDGTAK